MKRAVAIYRFILMVCIGALGITDVFAQKEGMSEEESNVIFAPILHPRITADCTPITTSGCNLIANNNFVPTSPYSTLDPFSPGNVPSWLSTHGTPQLYDIFNLALTPPSPATGFVFMYGDGMPNVPISYPDKGEGIAQKTPQLVTGNKYVLSFYRRYTKSVSWSNNLDQLNVVLMNCSDYQHFSPITEYTPAKPTNSQTVYCETNVANQFWEKVIVKFTAASAYDMIWLYPRMTTHNAWGGIDIAYPELIDVTSFTAGASPSATSSCTNVVTIGPSVPNCGVDGAVFNWYGPSGQIVTAPSNQQITIDADTDYGTWTLKMEFPTAATTNSTCGQTWQITASVNVPQPIANPLSIVSPTCQFYDYNNAGLVTQNLVECDYVSICNGNELLIINATSNQLSSNIWTYNVTYLNGITGLGTFNNTVDPINTTGSTLSLSNTLSGYFVYTTLIYAVVEITLTNSITGTSKSLFIRIIPKNAIVDICNSTAYTGYKIMMSTWPSHPDYTYLWSFPTGFNVIDNTALNAIYDDGTYSGSYPTSATFQATNIYGCGTQTQVVPLISNPPISCNARMSSVTNKNTTVSNKKMVLSNSNSDIRIYPNPAQDIIFFETKRQIKEAVIRNVNGVIVKKLIPNKTNNAIDISSLAKGMYIVSVLDSKGKNSVSKLVKQ